MSFHAVLLAGGRSTRMGQDKAQLQWRGVSLLDFQVQKLAALNPDGIIISCRAAQGYEHNGCAVIHDEADDGSPLQALLRCLRAVENPVLVLAVDMPLITPSHLSVLVREHRRTGRGVVFQNDGRFEPLCALYPAEMIAVLEEAVLRGNLSLQHAIATGITLGCMEALPLPAEWTSAFINTNTPDEWNRALPPT